jgi:hypothetical protein
MLQNQEEQGPCPGRVMLTAACVGLLYVTTIAVYIFREVAHFADSVEEQTLRTGHENCSSPVTWIKGTADGWMWQINRFVICSRALRFPSRFANLINRIKIPVWRTFINLGFTLITSKELRTVGWVLQQVDVAERTVRTHGRTARTGQLYCRYQRWTGSSLRRLASSRWTLTVVHSIRAS